MKKLIGFIILCCTVFGSSLCSSANPGLEEKKDFVITMIAKSSTNPVFLAARFGAETAASEYSKKLGFNIKIDWKTPSIEDPTEQIVLLSNAVKEKTNAVLISCSDADELTNPINSAVDSGVPVMCFDNDAPASKRFAYYGIDNIELGKQLMVEMAKQLNGRGIIAILSGNKDALNLKERVKGVMLESKNYPKIKIVGTFYSKETPESASTEVISAMAKYPKIGGWVMTGCWALLSDALQKDLKPSKVKVVSVDVMPEVLPYIAKGIVPVVLSQPTFNWGYVGVERIIQKVILKQNVPAINKMEIAVVTKANLGFWANQLKSWKYNNVDQEYLDLK